MESLDRLLTAWLASDSYKSNFSAIQTILSSLRSSFPCLCFVRLLFLLLLDPGIHVEQFVKAVEERALSCDVPRRVRLFELLDALCSGNSSQV